MRYVTFGEIMLRLKPPGFERFFQSPRLEATFGGAESNVAAGLAGFGLDTSFITLLPQNKIGDACVAELMKYGINTSGIVRKGDRVGIYFLEQGNNQRPSNVIYDRTRSAIAGIEPGDIDWKSVLKECGWFHISGITPALSEGAAGQAIEAVRTARRQGATVSCDLNFRKKLWRYGKPAPEVMRELMDYVDITVGNEEDVQKSLEIETDVDVESGSIDIERFKSLTGDVLNQFDSLKKIAVTIRTSLSADVNLWQAVLNNRHEFIVSREYEIRDIVDRVGSGDAFCAGLIYGLSILEDDRKALEFATASGCLKHSVHGDFPLATVDEVMSLVRGSGSGRIQR